MRPMSSTRKMMMLGREELGLAWSEPRVVRLKKARRVMSRDIGYGM